MAIRIIVIENHLLALQTMSAELGRYADIEVVDTITDTIGKTDLSQLIRENRPDIVVLDLSVRMSNIDPVTAVATLEDNYPDVAVLVLISREDDFLVRGLIDAGVNGCLFSSDEQVLSLGTVVRKISEAKSAHSRKVMERYFELRDITLAPRELEILRLMAEGLSNNEIAERLTVSSSTVRNYLSSAYAKLDVSRKAGVNCRVCAINRAKQLGLL